MVMLLAGIGDFFLLIGDAVVTNKMKYTVNGGWWFLLLLWFVLGYSYEIYWFMSQAINNYIMFMDNLMATNGINFVWYLKCTGSY